MREGDEDKVFLGGWGGVVAIAIALAVAAACRQLVGGTSSWLVDSGSFQARPVAGALIVLSLALFAVSAYVGRDSKSRMESLRDGTGDWTDLWRTLLELSAFFSALILFNAHFSNVELVRVFDAQMNAWGVYATFAVIVVIAFFSWRHEKSLQQQSKTEEDAV